MLIIEIFLFICYLISTGIHESGHGFFVKFTNNKLIELRLGRGRRNEYLFKIGDLEVKKLFFLSGSRALWSFNTWDNFKREGVLISLGGCIANFLTFIVSLPIGLFFRFLSIEIGAYFFLVLAVISAFQMFVNLLPIQGFDGGQVIKYSSNPKEVLIRKQIEFNKYYEEEN